MKYLCLLYSDEAQSPPPGSPEMNQILRAGHRLLHLRVRLKGRGGEVGRQDPGGALRRHRGPSDPQAGLTPAKTERAVGWLTAPTAGGGLR